MNATPSKTRTMRIVVAFLVALATTIVIVSRWLPHTETILPWLVGAVAGGATFCAFLAYSHWRREANAAYRSLWGMPLAVIGALATGALVIFVVPIDMPPLVFSSQEKLSITALGKKNPLSNSTEVWVPSVERIDGTKIEIEEFTRGEGWYIKNGTPLAGGFPPNPLTWEGEVRGALIVTLHSHAWSGKAEIVWRGETQQIDLYAPTATSKRIKLDVPPPLPNLDKVLVLLIYVSHAIFFGVVLLLLVDQLVSIPGRENPPRGMWRWGVYTGVCVAVWSISLAAYWPGLMSSDSIDQWREMIQWDISDAHPALSTMFFWLATRVYESPAAIASMHILVLAMISGWGLWRFRRDGVPAVVIWLTLMLFAFSTVNARFVISIWKDVLFSAFMLLFVLLLRDVVASRGLALKRWGVGLTLVLSGVLIAVLRHNGLPAVVAGLAVLVLFFPRQWWRVLILGLTLGAGIFLVRGPLYAAVGVENIFSFEKLQRNATSVGGHTTWLLAAHVKAGTPLEEDELELLTTVVSPEDLGKNYDPFRRTMMRNVNWHRTPLVENRDAVNALVLKLNERAPQVYWRHIYWRTSMVWRVEHAHNSFYSRVLGEKWNGKIFTIFKNPYGIKPAPLSEALQEQVYGWMMYLQRGNGFWLNWRPALQLWGFLLAVVVAAIRTRSPGYLALAVPIVIHSFFVAMLAPAQDFRYQYPVFLCGMLMAPALCFLGRREETGAKPIITDEAD